MTAPSHPMKDSTTPLPAPAGEPEMPKCAVRGLIRPGVMCGSVIVGGVFCGHAGKCKHKIEPDAAERVALDVGVRTGHPPGMLQDDDRKLSEALASKPDAMRHAREAVAAIAAAPPQGEQT